ncbi:DsrH/TusB family sulfur metabolism protein [Gallaecimonas kandeliae]|uniref:DsrH/TusB family sulfur relay protein n=1 Tax=Gallaecimonas kandeliae TaxID=3029055 RepID=UPI0026472CA8|nr:DsrH/TusB family sulfur metabolism protein [Gallaecimonas kandeliae]WKE67268.1 DsrH/TusB family sulfur metabolism protein [Gallaecimonas kandeliae]
MSTLHIISNRQAFARAQSLMQSGDAVLFHGDGCYQALEALPSLPCYWLQSDARARALCSRCPPAITAIEWPRVVALTLDFDNTVTW